MNSLNRDLIDVIKDMPQEGVSLNVVTINDRQIYEYQCYFLIDQIAAYSADVRTMQVDVAYKRVSKTFSLLGDTTFPSSSDLNNQILNSRKIRKSFVNDKDAAQKSNTIMTTSIDIFGKSRKISKFRLQQTGFIDLAKIDSNFSSVVDVPTVNLSKIIAADLVKNAPPPASSTSGPTIHSRLTLRGNDPAALIESANLVTDATLARKGIDGSQPSESGISSSFLSRQQAGNVNNLPPQTLQTQLQQSVTTDIKLPFTFRITTGSIPPSGKIVLICTIRKTNGDIVQKIDFTINHSRQVLKYNIPRSLPVSGIQFSDSTHAHISVFNRDPRVSGVRVYSRDVPDYQTVSEQSNFVSIADIGSDWRQKSSVTRLPIKSVSNKLIRTVPVLTGGVVLGNFESKTYTRKGDIVGGSVIAVSNKGIVTVQIHNTPASYLYVQFVRRTVNSHQKAWENIQNPIKIGLGIAAIVDYSVKVGRTYEYAAYLCDSHGNMRRSRGTSIIAVTDYTSGTEINVEQVSLTAVDGTSTVTYNVSVNLVKDSDVTSILNATKDLGIDAYFSPETIKLSGDLSAITKVNVKRFSLDTGEIKDMGVIPPGTFTDSSTENVTYIFEGLLRGQADFYEEIGAQSTSPRTYDPKDALQRNQIVSSALTTTANNNKVNFTQKFLSKKSLLRGTISYGNTRSKDVDASGFLQGRLGITQTSTIQRSNPVITIGNFDLIAADDRHRILTFDVQSESVQKNIDFFIISVLRGGVRSVIGACHYIDTNVKQNFLDNRTRLTTGVLSYVITPVRFDGTTMDEIITQQFEVM